MINLYEDGEFYPRTFEEWVEIHGEPEYLEVTRNPHALSIKVIKNETVEPDVDTSNVFYFNEKEALCINYNEFVRCYIEQNKCIYSHGAFYTPDGMVSAMSIRKDIYETLECNGWRNKADGPTNSIFTSIKDKCSVDNIEVDEKLIPLQNGDLYIYKDGWEFHEGVKTHTPYRLSVDYVHTDTPTPLFDKWLEELFDKEDIETVQEIVGYCLVPSTVAQESFYLVGEGGAGKSGLGTILEGLMGNAYIPVKTQELVTGRFGIATLENKLVAYDDDLGSGALTETSTFKKLITADQKIPAERKYSDEYSFRPYCRLIASTNFMLTSLYDDSEGFYRRLHPIQVKRPDKDRRVIKGFYEMILKSEKEQILRWALKGLQRVINNGWTVHWSEKSKILMQQVRSTGTHFEDFLEDTCDFVDDSDVTSAELKKLYTTWCKRNAIKEVSDKRFNKWLNDNADRLNITRSNNIKRDGIRLRGFSRLKIKNEWQSSGIISL